MIIKRDGSQVPFDQQKIINAIIYNIPPFAVLCLALSVVFRRKGYPKTGFFIQFGGILLFVLMLML
jgi:hypothetical protein